MTTNIDTAISARHRWIESIASKQSHYVISKKWESFCILVVQTGMTMYEFEKFLKHTNYNEYMYAQTAKGAWQEYKRD